MITEISKTVNAETNVEFKMFTSDHPKRAGMFGVRQFDLDCKEIVSLIFYPTLEQAKANYAKMVATA